MTNSFGFCELNENEMMAVERSQLMKAYDAELVMTEGVQGKGEGYKLSRTLKNYIAGEILRLTDGNLAPVA